MARSREHTFRARVQHLGEYLAGRGREHGPPTHTRQPDRGSWGEANATVRAEGWETVRAGFGGSLFGSDVGDAFGAFGLDDGYEMGHAVGGSWGQGDDES
jgi:hypothetical protein